MKIRLLTMKLLSLDENFLTIWLIGSYDTQQPTPQITYKLNFYYTKIRNTRIISQLEKIQFYLYGEEVILLT